MLFPFAWIEILIAQEAISFPSFFPAFVLIFFQQLPEQP
jgi:hypothetical protein